MIAETEILHNNTEYCTIGNNKGPFKATMNLNATTIIQDSDKDFWIN